MVGILVPERIPSAVLEKFVEQSKGGEKADGTFNGEKYFEGQKDRSIFIPVSKMRKVISGETLLGQMKSLTKQIKAQRDEISALEDQINLADKAVPANFGAKPEAQPDDSSSAAIAQFLQREVKKGWYVTFNDL